MNINDYLLANPKAVEGLFTKIFGKYMLRYYNHDGYAVQFDENASTSYQDEKNKLIVIALDNVIAMLQKGVNVLAVAYHELAHTLYTKNDTRDKIRKKAIENVFEYCQQTGRSTSPFTPYHDTFSSRIHAIWNVLEDTRIERLLADEFTFLKPIIEPLKTIIDPNNDELFKWRVHGTCKQSIADNADGFCLSKKQSQITLATYISNIYIELYLHDDQKAISDQVKSNYTEHKQKTKGDSMEEQLSTDNDVQKQRERQRAGNQAKQTIKSLENDINDTQSAIDNAKKILEDNPQLPPDKVQDYLEYINNATSYADTDKQRIEHAKQRFEELTGESYDEFTEKQASENHEKQLDVIKSIETNDSSEQAVKSMLESIQKTIIDNAILEGYTKAVKDYNDSKDFSWAPKIERIYSAKQKIRQGLNAVQAKRYSINISNKVNVPRIVSSKANHTAPQVFYGRGKDVEFTKKVVIFEDVSSSTDSFTHIFSSIAHSLAESFESVEWYGYGDDLFVKQPKHYNLRTRNVGKIAGLQIGGTSTYKLLNVMKKYQNTDNIYVIITDGDMSSIFKDNDLWSFYKEKCVVIGFIDKEIKDNAPHHVDILADIAKRLGYIAKPNDRINDIMNNSGLTYHGIQTKSIYQPAVVKGINGVYELIKSRIR
jgi:hypothetical protein